MEIPEHLRQRAEEARKRAVIGRERVAAAQDLANRIRRAVTPQGGIIESEKPLTDPELCDAKLSPELHAAYEAGHYKLPPDLMVANAHRVIEKRPERWRQVGWRHKTLEVLTSGEPTDIEQGNWEPVYACTEPPPEPPRVFKVTFNALTRSMTTEEIEDLLGGCKVEEVTHESHS